MIFGKRGRRTDEEADRMATAGHAAMTWAQRLKRVFKIDIETCSHCGGAVKIIACIEDPMVIEKILTHLNKQTASAKPPVAPEPGTPSSRPVGHTVRTNQPETLLAAEAAGHVSA